MENNMETQYVTATAHYTHIHCDKEIELLRCSAETCRCLKVHCPFCDVGHFKPAGSMRVRDHITQSHFKYAVTMGNVLIVKCFHKCVMSPGHFHCPYCDQQLYKRIAFAQHLKSHLKKMGKNENVVHFFYSNHPATIKFDGMEIPLCADSCTDTLHQHYHCPLCGKNSFSNMGSMVTHLWRCRDRRKHRRGPVGSQTGGSRLRGANRGPPLRETLADTWHLSIVRTVDDLEAVRCDLGECCGNKFHCLLCPSDIFQPAVDSELKQHLRTHWDSRVISLDYSIVPCYLDCEETRGDLRPPGHSHYHCPFCGHTHRGMDRFTSHLAACSRGDNSQQGSGLIFQKDGTDSVVRSEKNTSQFDRDPSSDKNVSIGKSEHSIIPEETISLKTKQETFEPITAILCKEMISRLEDRGDKSVTDLLEEITLPARCTWTWSPGTQGTVYALTGGLENLLEAKYRLNQILNTTSTEEQHQVNAFRSRTARITTSSVSVQTNISLAVPESSSMSHDASLPVQMDGDLVPMQNDGSAMCKEEVSVDPGSTDIEKHPIAKKRKHHKDVDEGKVMKRKAGRPKKNSEQHRTCSSSVKGGKEISKIKKRNTDLDRVNNNVRILSRVSSSPYSKRKTVSTPTKSLDDGIRVSKKYTRSLKTKPLVSVMKDDLTKTIIKKAYSTRGKQVDFSLLATGRTKKDQQNATGRTKKDQQKGPKHKTKLLSKAVNHGQKTKLKELSVQLVDIDKHKIKSKSETQNDIDDSDEGPETWQDDSDDDPDYIPAGKKKVSDSDDADDDYFKQMTSRDDNIDKTEKNAVDNPKTERTENENMNKILTKENQMFYVPKITVPLSALHQSIQRMRPDDGMQNGDAFDESEDKLADQNLKCSYCDFTAQSSVELMGHIMDVHRLDQRHSCSGCGKKFVTHQSRSLHLQTTQCGRDKPNLLHHCTKCSFSSDRFSDVTDHLIKDHQVANPLRCDVCERRLKDKHKHLRLHHGPNPRVPYSDTDNWGCQFCEFTAEQFADVTDHLIEIHSISDPLRCDVCEVTFKQSKAYHIKQRHGPVDKYTLDKSTSCLLCRVSFPLFSDLTQHIIDEHHLDNVRCDVCELIFSSTHALSDHLNKTHGPSDIQCCNICGRGFNTFRALAKHRQTIHQVQTKQLKSCKKCDFRGSKKEVKQHMESHVVENECPICHKVLAKHTNIAVHIDTMHTKQEECVCNICGKKFRHPRYLRLHLGRHSGIKPHVCSVCGKRFYGTNTLRSHMEVHKDRSERQYRHICSVCGRGFNSKSGLDDHTNKHTGARPHACPLCGARFGFRSMLYKHHQFVHSSLRPFLCTICPKSYKSKQRLSAHMVGHTGVSRFNCDHCKKPFSTSSTLKHHLSRCRGDRGKGESRILRTVTAGENEIVIHLVNGEDGEVKIEPLEHTDVVHIVQEIARADLGEGGQAETEGGRGDQVSQVFLCSVCAVSFDTYEAAESHIATNHVETEQQQTPQQQQQQQQQQTAQQQQQVFESMQTDITPKQEVFDYW